MTEVKETKEQQAQEEQIEQQLKKGGVDQEVADKEAHVAEQTAVKEEKKASKGSAAKKQPAAPKKDEARVDVSGVPISTKTAVAACNFVRGKRIDRAIAELELVKRKKLPLPMKGEIPHQKGKGVSSARYPKRVCEEFLTLLRSLESNALQHGIDTPLVSTAVANKAPRPMGRGGIERKRTHVLLCARNKK